MQLETLQSWLIDNGVSFRVEGERLIGKLPKDAPPNIIAAIRKHKPTIIEQYKISADLPVEERMLDSILADGWQGNLALLVAWVWLAELPTEPFSLRGEHIQDVKKFYRDLGEILNLGPNSSRARNGELEADLIALRHLSIQIYGNK